MVLFLLVTNAHAEIKTITFYETDAADMIVQLEDGDKKDEIIKATKEEVDICVSRNFEMQTIVDEKGSQLDACDTALKNLKELNATQKKSYEKIIDETKTSIFEKIGIAGGGMGVGLLIGVIIAVMI
jgi:phosphopantothenate synthetase